MDKLIEISLLRATLKIKLIDLKHCQKRGVGGLAISKVLGEISDNYKLVYFTSSNDIEST